MSYQQEFLVWVDRFITIFKLSHCFEEYCVLNMKEQLLWTTIPSNLGQLRMLLSVINNCELNQRIHIARHNFGSNIIL